MLQLLIQALNFFSFSEKISLKIINLIGKNHKHSNDTSKHFSSSIKYFYLNEKIALKIINLISENYKHSDYVLKNILSSLEYFHSNKSIVNKINSIFEEHYSDNQNWINAKTIVDQMSKNLWIPNVVELKSGWGNSKYSSLSGSFHTINHKEKQGSYINTFGSSLWISNFDSDIFLSDYNYYRKNKENHIDTLGLFKTYVYFLGAKSIIEEGKKESARIKQILKEQEKIEEKGNKEKEREEKLITQQNIVNYQKNIRY